MATQTTLGLSFVKAVVFVSDDAKVTWTDITGHGASVAMSTGERSSGEQNTLAGVKPIVKFGDNAADTVTVRFIFTQGDDPEPFELLRAVRESEDPALEVQWAPAGGGATFWMHADGGLTSLLYPGGEAGDGAVIMSEFVVKCAQVDKAAASVDAA